MKSLQALKNTSVKVKQPVVDDSPTGSQLEDILIERIDVRLSSRNKKDYRKVEYFRPSNTNQCSRYWYYVFNGIDDYPTQFSSQTYRIFDNGHAVHDRLYSYFRDMGILVEEELPVSYDDPPIQGTADGIIDLYGNRLIELKSISAEGFEYRRLAHKPSDDHYRQAQIYMQCLDLDSGFVIYENKNNQKILPIYIERDHKFIDKLFNKYRKIYKSVQEGIMPDRPYKRTSKHCASCDLEKHCWADLSLSWPDPDPRILAVPPRNTTTVPEPAQGPEMPDEGEQQPVHAAMLKQRYSGLTEDQTARLSIFVLEARQAMVPIRVAETPTARRCNIAEALLNLIERNVDDIDIRALLVTVLGDIAERPTMALGALVGLLDWQRAQTFVQLTQIFNQTIKESIHVIR